MLDKKLPDASSEELNLVDLDQRVTSLTHPMLRFIMRVGLRKLMLDEPGVPLAEINPRHIRGIGQLQEEWNTFQSIINELGLERVDNPVDLSNFLQTLENELNEASNEELFNRIVQFRNYYKLFNTFQNHADEYLTKRVKLRKFGTDESALEKLDGKSFLEWLREYAHEPIDRIYTSTVINNEDSIDGLFQLLSDTQLAFTPIKHEVARSIHWREGVILDFIYQYLVKRFADRLPKDRILNKPLVQTSDGYDIDDFTKAQAYGAEIPDPVARLGGELVTARPDRVDRYLMGKIGMMDYDHYKFFEKPSELEKVIDILFESRELDEVYDLFHNFQRANTAFDNRYQNKELTSKEQIALRMDRDKTLNALRSKILVKLKAIYSTSAQSIHPQIEYAIRYFSSYALSTGEGTKTFYGFHWLVDQDFEQEGRSLSQSVITLDRIALEEGIDLTPLVINVTKQLLAFNAVSRDNIVRALNRLHDIQKVSGEHLTSNALDFAAAELHGDESDFEVLVNLMLTIFYKTGSLNESESFIPQKANLSMGDETIDKQIKKLNSALVFGDKVFKKSEGRSVAEVDDVLNQIKYKIEAHDRPIYAAALRQLEAEMAETNLLHECLALIPENDDEAKIAMQAAYLLGREKSGMFDFSQLKKEDIELYNKIMFEYGLLEFLESKSQ